MSARSAPAAERNAEPIAQVLDRHAPETGRALELASGTGQHAAAFARRYPGLDWQPTDADPAALPDIRAWTEGCANIRAPAHLDAARPGWAARWSGFDLVLLVNLLHLISDTDAGTVLTEAAHALGPGGRFVLYGPFRRDGRLVSAGDARFDAALRARDPAIGYKDVEAVEDRLRAGGLVLCERVGMPADNLLLVAARPLFAARPEPG